MKRLWSRIPVVPAFLGAPPPPAPPSGSRRVPRLWSNGAQRRHSGIWRDVPFPELGHTPKASGKKITIVGVGQRSIASGLALQHLFREKNIVYYYADVADKGFNFIPQDKGSVLLRPGVKLNTTKDLAKTRNSEVCIFGVEATREATKEEIGVMQTIQMYAELIPKLVSLSPKATVIVLSDPVNLMSYCSWKFSGLPAHKIIGSGTLLETLFFKKFLQWKMQIDNLFIDGWVIGGTDISTVPLWTSVSASGMQLVDMKPDVLKPIKDKENWGEVNFLLKQVNGELRKTSPMALKLYGEEVARLTEAVLWNTGTPFPVSTYAVGLHGIVEEVFLSLPSVVNRHGLVSRVRQTLSPRERRLLMIASARMAILQKLFRV